MNDNTTEQLLFTTNSTNLVNYITTLDYQERQQIKDAICDKAKFNREKLRQRLIGNVKFTDLEKEVITTLFVENKKTLFPI